ncbi:ATP-binding protein [Algoriphagus halophytocola]|uniref:histidine kinase n=1 Tax=Algoriphagus halophytocola TaxID=2991499 RepID=A0ABY6MCG0_9BACT|nr:MULTISPECIES: ATP-binding protein [unclassified Algoriphagus]UZD21383.1 ATP-binding protein [Algoriphagus sp. TR-M5]WBL42595.1 ATP-binding protein [Algoriphagus sp. TR-M9]
MDFILLIIAFRFLQTHDQTKNVFPEWQGIFFKGLVAASCLLAIQIIFDRTDPFLRWVAHIINLSVVYATYNKEEFFPLKPYVYAFFPVIVVHVAEDFVRMIAPGFYESWHELFNTAAIFAWIWLVAQFIINRKQRKELERERILAAQKELEYKQSQKLKDALEIQVAERTAEITAQKEELLNTLNELKSMQSQLIQSEKMASLGELTAGIAHEIQNPLNFVTNFSELNNELLQELKVELENGDLDEVKLILSDLQANEEKIIHHGKRADAIVKGMLQHSRSSTGVKEPTDINELADEYLRLSYHGLRAKDKTFNATMETDFDQSLGRVEVVSQEIGRVILNLVNNAFYAVAARKELHEKNKIEEPYQPTVWVSTLHEKGRLIIKVRDNGTGIPQQVKEKIFQPFFTTKPTGHGTGLGLSLSYDIIKAHGGELQVHSVAYSEQSNTQSGTEFVIDIPYLKAD